MAQDKTSFWLFCFVVLFESQSAQICKDIDTAACKLLSAQQPNLCSDPSISKTVCPRFCNLCALECYDCNTTLTDYHDCNTTKQCAEGEICMRKELHSFIDGHAEYELTCESKALCDGSNLMFNFGKRSPHTRDVSIHCCSDDLCNYPKQVQITNCGKDIEFMIDSSVNSLQGGDKTHLIAFLFKLIQKLDIGPNDNLIGLSEYDLAPHVQWSLNTYNDKYDVLRAVQGLNLLKAPSHFQLADTDAAVEFIVQHALTPSSGDRPDHRDAVVLIASSDTARRISVSLKDTKQLQQLSNDVIVISVGPDSQYNTLDNVATDNNHAFHAPTYSTINDTMISAVISLLKAC